MSYQVFEHQGSVFSDGKQTIVTYYYVKRTGLMRLLYDAALLEGWWGEEYRKQFQTREEAQHYANHLNFG